MTPSGQRYVAVRMNAEVADAEWLADNLSRLPDDVAERVVDQLWLRTVFIEQRRRMRVAERPSFDARADRVLSALDPGADATEIMLEVVARRLEEAIASVHEVVGCPKCGMPQGVRCVHMSKGGGRLEPVRDTKHPHDERVRRAGLYPR